jgi:hypothetical protein
VAQYAYFPGQEQDAKRYRWLAQTVSQGGTHGKDCDKNMLTLPWVSYEDTGAPTYKNPHDPAQPWYHSPSFQKTLTDPKQLAAANNDARLIALRYPFPKLKGPVYGFDADGKRTGELLLNADLLNISIYNEGACVQAQYPTGTAADRAYRDRELRYAKAVQALFQDGAYSAPGGAPEYAAINKTVLFSNDPADVPHVPKAQPAPADVAAKLNARLKAKLARDLEGIRKNLQARLARWDTPSGIASVMGDAPYNAETLRAIKTRRQSDTVVLAMHPASIDTLFTSCPALQFALDAQGSRMLYMLNCGSDGHAIGFYEQTAAGELVLVKVAPPKGGQSIFSNGMANFPISSWLEPYVIDWQLRWTEQGQETGQGTAILSKERPIRPDLIASGHTKPYKKGQLRTSAVSEPYIHFRGVHDLLPQRSTPAAQVYLSISGHHESPFALAGFEPGAKPGDAWTERKQTWPVGMQE